MGGAARGVFELTEAQLRAALDYYALHPREINERLQREAYWTPERVAAELPFTRPSYRRESGS